MISLAEAQSRLLALAVPVAIEDVPLLDANGRWLAADIIAKRTQPAKTLSAMDGYAVRAGDGPSWNVIGESAAGLSFPGMINAGEAVRIFTGAALPAGSDAIVIQENITRDGDSIRQTEGTAPAKGDHTRPAGSDFHAGDCLILAGSQIGPAKIALAAMGGYGTLPVRRKIRVVLLSTGDELMPPGSPVDEDHIPASNGVMIAASLSGWPVEIVDPGIVPDTMEATRAAIAAARDANVIVTIGGASVGDHDLVRPALLAEGAVLDFWKVALRPGKPVMVGTLGNAITLGLPGNPVSAFVTALLFLKPLIAALSGASAPLPEAESVTLGGSLPANGERLDFVRARFVDGRMEAVGTSDSAALSALSLATALIIRQPGAPAAIPDEIVDIIRTA